MITRISSRLGLRRSGKRAFSIVVTTAFFLLLSDQPLTQAQSFESGSNGSDGVLDLTTPGLVEFDPTAFNPRLDLDEDNIYHFTTIHIGSGVTVRLSAKFLKGPVYWLASGTIQIDAGGILDLNGEAGQGVNPAGVPFPALPGAGGYPGGVKAQAGNGPFGGAAPFAAPGCFILAGGGGGPNTAFLTPLFGGSGGGGGAGSGGGAGGGALLIASSMSITVNGTIMANGGARFSDSGGGGGGGLRLAAPSINGGGILSARGTGNGNTGPGCNRAGEGGFGVIRLEAFQQNFTGSSQPTALLRTPFALFLPTTSPPLVHVTSIDGNPVPSTPTGSFIVPDVAINKSTPVTVQIQAHNIPLTATVTLFFFSENGPDLSPTVSALSGTEADSTATASVTLPPGFSRGYVRATWTNQ